MLEFAFICWFPIQGIKAEVFSYEFTVNHRAKNFLVLEDFRIVELYDFDMTSRTNICRIAK